MCFFGSFLEWLRRAITAESRRNCENINNRLEAVHKELNSDINTVKNSINARLDKIENNDLVHIDAKFNKIDEFNNSLISLEGKAYILS
jgi:hypothetical protein